MSEACVYPCVHGCVRACCFLVYTIQAIQAIAKTKNEDSWEHMADWKSRFFISPAKRGFVSNRGR